MEAICSSAIQQSRDGRRNPSAASQQDVPDFIWTGLYEITPRVSNSSVHKSSKALWRIKPKGGKY